MSGLNIAYVNGGQQPESDNYAYEEEQEREAMMKLVHRPMKDWYNAKADLKEKYGEYPLFWQDFKTWEPFREVHKMYLIDTDTGGRGKQDENKETNDGGGDGQQAGGKVEEPKKKRRSRWGDASEDGSKENGDDGGRKRKTRWGHKAETPTATVLTPQQQQILVLRVKLQEVDRKLQTVAQDCLLRAQDPTRSPSPPPQYDSNGNRVNTREARTRQKLMEQKQKIMEEMIALNPLFKTEGFQRTKITKKIYIPVKDYPGYNFIGLIIGPRGNTQKKMEKETNCKIAIRGKGSVKEGSKRVRDGKTNADDDDELHVLVTGDKQEEVDRATEMIEDLLVPVDDMKNEHKQKQLRELALINGTLRDDDYCHICGEKGHRQWECPKREKEFKGVEITCAICGDSSHPTVDCPEKKKGKGPDDAAMDKEYLNFMAELGEGAKPAATEPPKAPEPPAWQPPAAAAPPFAPVPNYGYTPPPPRPMPPPPGAYPPYGAPPPPMYGHHPPVPGYGVPPPPQQWDWQQGYHAPPPPPPGQGWQQGYPAPPPPGDHHHWVPDHSHHHPPPPPPM